jgi:Iap family predicted aminopeptidase
MSDPSPLPDDLLEFLCKSPRVAGSQRNAEVVQRLQSLFNEMGFRTRVHEFAFTGWRQLEPPAVRYLDPIQRDVDDCLPVVWSKPTDGKVIGRIQAVAGFPRTLLTFESYEWKTFPVVDASGKIVACLLGNSVAWPQPLDDDAFPVPCVLIGGSEYDRLDAWMRGGVRPTVEVSIASEFLPGQRGRNLIAGEIDQPSVVACAHYDSFFTTTGAHDNASGVAALLDLARRLRVRPRSDLALVCFDGEEWNKLGSYRLADAWRATGQLDRLKAVINIDSVGVGTGIYLAASPGLANPIRQSLARAEAVHAHGAAKPAYLDRSIAIQDDAAPKAFDSWPFARLGVPAVQVGSFGLLFPYWHRPGDQLGLIDDSGGQLIADVAALAVDLLAFWVPPEN